MGAGLLVAGADVRGDRVRGGVVAGGVGGPGGGQRGLAEAVERPGLAVPFAGVADDGQGLLVVVDGPVGPAEPGVEQAEAVQRRRPRRPGGRAAGTASGRLEVLVGRLVPARLRLDVAESVQRAGLGLLVAGLPGQGQGLLAMVDGRPVAARLAAGCGRARSAAFASPVRSPTCRYEDQGLPLVVDRPPESGPTGPSPAEVVHGAGLAGRVAGLPEQVQRLLRGARRPDRPGTAAVWATPRSVSAWRLRRRGRRGRGRRGGRGRARSGRRCGGRRRGSGTTCGPAGWCGSGQPWAAVCAATATRVGRSVSSQVRAASGSVRSGPGVPAGGIRGRWCASAG